MAEKHNVAEWLEANKSYFLPPVCNKLMYADQLKVMYVGGPNQREDYHIEEGEEIFFQVKGTMCVKVMEKGKPKDVFIKEGEIWLLPPRIPHSPNRYENTVGLVIERERLDSEVDGLRYYCRDGSGNVLFEKWFHCEDLGTQLKPIIEEFFASEQYKTGVPVPGTVREEPPIQVDESTELGAPFALKEFVDKHKAALERGECIWVFPETAEFKVQLHGGTLTPTTWKSKGETWFWQICGEASLDIAGKRINLCTDDVWILAANTEASVHRSTGSVGMTVTADPPLRK